MKSFRFTQVLTLSLICSFLLTSTSSFAAKNPDFTGEWTLNEDNSDFGDGPAFAAIKIVVKQEGNTITIERTRMGRDGEERTSSETLTMDGKENINENERGTSSSVVSWSDDGSNLIITSNREFNRDGQNFGMNTKEVWTLSEDGKILKIQSDTSSPRGERSVSLIYDKK